MDTGVRPGHTQTHTLTHTHKNKHKILTKFCGFARAFVIKFSFPKFTVSYAALAMRLEISEFRVFVAAGWVTETLKMFTKLALAETRAAT